VVGQRTFSGVAIVYIGDTHNNRLAAGQWQVERGTGPRGTYHAGALGDWGAGEQPVVVCGVGQK
jgi:hypothetical protein